MYLKHLKLTLLFLFSAAIFVYLSCPVDIQNSFKIREVDVPYDVEGCGCPRWAPPITAENSPSLCSDWSTARGNDQKVVAYSVYGEYTASNVRNFYSQIEDRIKEVNSYYEGWLVRLYHNSSEEKTLSLICQLVCKYPTFDPCQVNQIWVPETWHNGMHSKGSERRAQIENKIKNNLNEQIYNFLNPIMEPFNNYYAKATQSVSPNSNETGVEDQNKRKSFGESLIGRVWRFLPLGDESVKEFLVRDLDSFVLPREVAAVEDWRQNSTAPFHAMRDHPSHNGPILAGMWGGARWRDKATMTHFLKVMLLYPLKYYWNYDQVLLRKIIWAKASDKTLVHDSYHCRNPYLKAKEHPRPFPTRRVGHLFVSWGPKRSPSELRNIIPCPAACKPKEHLDWEFC